MQMSNRVTTSVMAEKWGISERRVRKLCEQGRVCGVRREGGRYLIPKEALKPTDFRGYRNLNIAQSRIGFLAELDAHRDGIYQYAGRTFLYQEILSESFAEELAWQHCGIDIIGYMKNHDKFPKGGSWYKQKNCANAAMYLCKKASLEQKISKRIVKETGFLLEDNWRKSGKHQLVLEKEWNAILEKISPFILRQRRSRKHPIEKAVIFYLELMVCQPFPKEQDMIIPLLLDFFLLQSEYPVVDPRALLDREHENALGAYRRTREPDRMIRYISEHLKWKLEKSIATNRIRI